MQKSSAAPRPPQQFQKKNTIGSAFFDSREKKKMEKERQKEEKDKKRKSSRRLVPYVGVSKEGGEKKEGRVIGEEEKTPNHPAVDLSLMGHVDQISSLYIELLNYFDEATYKAVTKSLTAYLSDTKKATITSRSIVLNQCHVSINEEEGGTVVTTSCPSVTAHSIHFPGRLLAFAADFLRVSYFIDSFNNGKVSMIHRLHETGALSATPLATAMFLSLCRVLSRKSISEYISDAAEFNAHVLAEYMKMQSYVGLDIEVSLRKMLRRVSLPIEGQKIDRILKQFGYQYYSDNKTLPGGAVFKDEKACHAFAFALMLLNTDLHNPNVPFKMTVDQFMINLSGYNGGQSFPALFLREMYSRIQEEEIVFNEKNDIHPDATRQGWLKLDNGNGQKSCYVVVSEGCLIFYKRKEDRNPKLQVSLSDIFVTPLSKEEAKGRKFSFLVHNPNLKIKYLLTAKTQEAVYQWLSAVDTERNMHTTRVNIEKEREKDRK